MERHLYLRRDGAGRPAGALIYHLGGILLLAGVIMLITLVAIVLALPRPAVKGSKGKPLPFRAVLGKIWLLAYCWRWARQDLA